MLPDWTMESAHFTDPQHRVWLRRRIPQLCAGSVLDGPGQFDGDATVQNLPYKMLVIIGHNPSVAGHEGADDPTMRRCVGFARACDCTDLVMVNAATGVATDADNLWQVPQPFYFALDAIQIAADYAGPNSIIVAAWGAPKGGKKYHKELMLGQFNRIKRMGLPLHTLRVTKAGWPEHPLYLPGDLRPQPWSYPHV